MHACQLQGAACGSVEGESVTVFTAREMAAAPKHVGVQLDETVGLTHAW
jgi:hypothetical protein